MLRIRSERLRRGWSQTVLAYRAKLSTSDISKIENSIQRPYPRQTLALAKALRIAPESLLDEVAVATPVHLAEREAERLAPAVPLEVSDGGSHVTTTSPTSARRASSSRC